MEIAIRRERVQASLQEQDIDVACVLKPHNVAYLSGFAPVCAGVIVPREGEALLVTLWLDVAEARSRCGSLKVAGYVFPGERLMDRLGQEIRKRCVIPRRVGVEKDHMLLRDFETLSRHFPNAEFVDITPAVDRLRAVKSVEELERMRRAAAITDLGMEAALGAVRPGVTELDVAAEAEYVMKKQGSERPAFSTFVASGERTLLAHPMASRRRIEPGEPVVVDLGASWEGYASDLCRTTFAGDPSPEQVARLSVIVEAQRQAAASLRDGAVCDAVYRAARRIFEKAGLAKVLPDDIGYGVGLRQSEFNPIIEKGSATVLRENMVVALLQTTAVSRSLGGLRVEDTFRVTRAGCERLTRHKQLA